MIYSGSATKLLFALLHSLSTQLESYLHYVNKLPLGGENRIHRLHFFRPDLPYTAHALSQFSHSPRTPHWKALIKANCSATRRSITGFCVFLGSSLISWQSKKQCVVSRTSIETEYRALADCTCEITWLLSLLQDLQIQPPKPIPIYFDNQSSIALASNPIQHARAKHIEIDCHFVKENIKSGLILPISIPSTQQAADALTKGLSRSLFQTCISKFGMCDAYTLPTCREGNGDTKQNGSNKQNGLNSKSATVNTVISSSYLHHHKSLMECSRM
ncbi:uncharacterized mitochondrial protein-like protein [Tanacetum coccineum]